MPDENKKSICLLSVQLTIQVFEEERRKKDR